MASTTIYQVLKKAQKTLDEALKKELRDQGHHLTGELEGSITGEITALPDGWQLIGTSLSYGQILNAGVRPDRIPFSGTGGGGGGKSQYIEGLKRFFMLRGLSEKEAQGAAFATAKKHQQEGMATDASERFSSTGTRFQFIKYAEEKVSQVCDTIVSDGIDEVVDNVYNQTASEII